MTQSSPTGSPPTPVPGGCIRVKVDGREIEVPRLSPEPITGRLVPTTMLQACRLANVDVPHYCYHPRLPVAGNCRMCLVEFALPAMGPDRKPILNEDGSPRMILQTLPYEPNTPRGAIACATPIAPGMEIFTRTPTVRKMREAVLESLLINHPLDCPICDQAGECKLQEYSLEYGQAESRFLEAKVHKPKQVDLGPRIMLDDERCILCSRCIRFTRHIAGDDALGIANRGAYSTLTHYPGRPFDNNYTLNTVDICPVGALTSKDFRFQMRVWFLKETKSLCTSCAMGCNIMIGSRENRIYRYTPRDNDAVNASWMCDAGRLNYKWIARPDRLAEVRVRTAAGTEKRTWANALADLGGRLRGVPRHTAAIIASARQTTEELFLLRRLAESLGAVTDSVPRLGEADHLLVQADKNPNSRGARLAGIAAQPLGANLHRIAKAIQTGKIRSLLVFGEDVTRHGLDAECLERLELLVVSDILPNATTAAAHFLLPGCAHAEKRGAFINAKGRLQRFLKAVEPPGDARPETEFLREIVIGLTGQEIPATAEGLFNWMSRQLPALGGPTWAALGDQGVDVPI